MNYFNKIKSDTNPPKSTFFFTESSIIDAINFLSDQFHSPYELIPILSSIFVFVTFSCPAFTHSCRCCLILECRLVVFLHQNYCTWSGPASFQLDILMPCVSLCTVMIMFSFLGVNLSFSFTFFNHSESLLCFIGSDHNLLQNSVDPFASGFLTLPIHFSIKFFVKLPLIISEHVVLLVVL